MIPVEEEFYSFYPSICRYIYSFVWIRREGLGLVGSVGRMDWGTVGASVLGELCGGFVFFERVRQIAALLPCVLGSVLPFLWKKKR